MTKLETFLQNASRTGEASIIKLPSTTGEGGEGGHGEGFGTLLRSISEKPQGASHQVRLAPLQTTSISGETALSGDSMLANGEEGDAALPLPDAVPDVPVASKPEQQLAALIQPGMPLQSGASPLTQAVPQQGRDQSPRASLLDLIQLPVDEEIEAGALQGRVSAQMKASVVHQETHFKPVPAAAMHEVIKPASNSPHGATSLGTILGARTPGASAAEQAELPAAAMEAISAARNVTAQPSRSTALSDVGNGETVLPMGMLHRIASAVVAESKRDATQEATQASQSAQSMTHVVVRASEGAVRVLDIQLHPAELGKVTVRMRLSGDALEMELQASSEATAELLRKDTEKLTSLLRTSGYRPESVVIVTAGADAQAQDSATGQRQHSGAQSQAGGFQQGAAQSDEQSRRNSQGFDNGSQREQHKSGTDEKTSSGTTGDLYL